MRMRSLSFLETSKTYPVALEPLSGLKGVIMASIEEEELDDSIWQRAIVTGTGSHVEVELLQHAPRSVCARYVGVRGQVAALPTPEIAQLRITLTHGAEHVDCTGDWTIKVSATSPLFVVYHQIECIAGLSKLLHPDAKKNAERVRDLLPFEHYLHGSCWHNDARFDLVEQHQLREADLVVTAAEEQKNGELFAIEDKEEGVWWWDSQSLVPYATFQQQENVAQLVAKVEAILYLCLDADQQKAVAQGFRRGPQATVVSGPAGNEKSTVAGALAVLCAAAGIPCQVLAPNHGAADQSMDCVLNVLQFLIDCDDVVVSGSARSIIKHKILRQHSQLIEKLLRLESGRNASGSLTIVEHRYLSLTAALDQYWADYTVD